MAHHSIAPSQRSNSVNSIRDIRNSAASSIRCSYLTRLYTVQCDFVNKSFVDARLVIHSNELPLIKCCQKNSWNILCIRSMRNFKTNTQTTRVAHMPCVKFRIPHLTCCDGCAPYRHTTEFGSKPSNCVIKMNTWWCAIRCVCVCRIRSESAVPPGMKWFFDVENEIHYVVRKCEVNPNAIRHV